MLEPARDPLETPVARPRILPIQRLGAFSEIVLCSGFPSQLLLIAILTTVGLSPRTPEGDLSPAFVFTLSLVDTAIVTMLVLIFLRAHHEQPREVLLGVRPIGREILLGVVLVPVVLGAVLLLLALILTLAPQLHDVPRNPLARMLETRQDAIIFGIVVMIAGGVREEIQRGFILHRFDQYLGGGVVGLVIFSMLFGLGHLEQGTDAAIATALLGAGWGIIYLVRRSIVAPMVSHAGFNLAQLVQFLLLR